jgi:hypothetical protein
MLGPEMADDRLDGGPAAQFTLDGGRYPSLLAGEEDPELVIERCIVAAISLVARSRLLGTTMGAQLSSRVPDLSYLPKDKWFNRAILRAL